MRAFLLTAAIAGAALAASVSLYPGFRKDGPVAEPGNGPVAAPLAGRVYLTPQQVAQTRSPALWPEPTRSLLAIDEPLRHGEWRWDDSGIPAGRAAVRVDLTTQLVSVTRGGHEIGTAVILYGADQGHATPMGRFPVLSKSAHYRSTAYDAPMPYALRLTADGVALHGSDVRAGRATHGCIGLPLEFARRLFNQVQVGDTVLILRSR